MSLFERNGGTLPQPWSVWEQLSMVTAVLKYGLHDWDTVSWASNNNPRPAAELELGRPVDWFNPRNCAAKYRSLARCYEGETRVGEEVLLAHIHKILETEHYGELRKGMNHYRSIFMNEKYDMALSKPEQAEQWTNETEAGAEQVGLEVAAQEEGSMASRSPPWFEGPLFSPEASPLAPGCTSEEPSSDLDEPPPAKIPRVDEVLSNIVVLNPWDPSLGEGPTTTLPGFYDSTPTVLSPESAPGPVGVACHPQYQEMWFQKETESDEIVDVVELETQPMQLENRFPHQEKFKIVPTRQPINQGESLLLPDTSLFRSALRDVTNGISLIKSKKGVAITRNNNNNNNKNVVPSSLRGACKRVPHAPAAKKAKSQQPPAQTPVHYDANTIDAMEVVITDNNNNNKNVVPSSLRDACKRVPHAPAAKKAKIQQPPAQTPVHYDAKTEVVITDNNNNNKNVVPSSLRDACKRVPHAPAAKKAKIQQPPAQTPVHYDAKTEVVITDNNNNNKNVVPSSLRDACKRVPHAPAAKKAKIQQPPAQTPVHYDANTIDAMEVVITDNDKEFMNYGNLKSIDEQASVVVIRADYPDDDAKVLLVASESGIVVPKIKNNMVTFGKFNWTSGVKPVAKFQLKPRALGPKKATSIVTPRYPEVEEGEYLLWKKAIAGVWGQIASHRYASLFLRPLALQSCAQCKQKFDLTTIKQRIESGAIKNTFEFQRNITTMFSNDRMPNNQYVEEMRRDTTSIIEAFLQSQLALQSGTYLTGKPFRGSLDQRQPPEFHLLPMEKTHWEKQVLLTHSSKVPIKKQKIVHVWSQPSTLKKM